MRKGKLVAQGSHASLACLLQLMQKDKRVFIEERKLYFKQNTPMDKWLNGPFTKICVSVDSESELMEVYDNAKKEGLNVALIEDNGLTEFHGVKTKTCLCIGPEWSDDIDKITKHLKLL